MFLEEDELLDIAVYYKKIGRHYVAYGEQVFNEVGLNEEDKGTYSKLKIRARPLTWGLYNDLQEAAMVEDGLGNRKWNYKVYKENKLRKIIVKWDATAKDEDGNEKPAPINHGVIGRLAPDIAEVILNVYDQMTLIDEDAEKKS